MANYCNYEVRVKGSRKAGLMIYASMPYLDYKDIISEESVGDYSQMCFSGNCKWSVNYGVNDHMPKVDLEIFSEADIEYKGDDYLEYSLRAKSEVFQCEIMVHYWSDESGFDQFDHYKNGELIKQRKIGYNYDKQNEFDWDKLEFVGHEGEYDTSVDGEEQNEDVMSKLLGVNGISGPEEPQMGDELLKWSFSEGRTVKGDGWTIAIPDGFVQRASYDVEPTTGQKRLFELVPASYKNEKDIAAIPVIVLPGATQEGEGLGDCWMVHPEARAAAAGIIGMSTAQLMAQLLGTAPELIPLGWSDVAAYILVQDTSGGTYSYQCTVINDTKNHLLRVQTQAISKKQKRLLDESVQTWLKTMRFDKPNTACPTKTKFEKSACYEELLKDDISMFEEAVNQAVTEYRFSIEGKAKCLEYMAGNGLLVADPKDVIKSILENSMAVKLFFLEKADKVIDRLQEKSVDPAVLKNTIQSLSVLDEDVGVDLGDYEKIEATVPKELQSIRDKWKGIALNASSEEHIAIKDRGLQSMPNKDNKPQEEARLKKERQNQEDEREKRQVREAIIDIIKNHEAPLTFPEIKEELGTRSYKLHPDTSIVSSILSQLIKEEYVVKTYWQKVAYFGYGWSPEEKREAEELKRRQKNEEEKRREEEKKRAAEEVTKRIEDAANKDVNKTQESKEEENYVTGVLLFGVVMIVGIFLLIHGFSGGYASVLGAAMTFFGGILSFGCLLGVKDDIKNKKKNNNYKYRKKSSEHNKKESERDELTEQIIRDFHKD